KAARLLWADAGRRPEGLVVLASTDLTHYGASFGVTPAGSGPAALEWARGNDWRWLDTLLELRSEAIVATAQRDGSACGAGAAAAAAGWAAEAGCRRGQVLAYASSHDSEKPGGLAEHFVDYASVIYECEG
ncbi:MAG: AmmeMemoRadiSam system protein B, partial [Planctomycetota bacterium]|nr:AmmeMemoRadiSam system protein B [Planctomycetota bacterium]